MKQTNNAIKFLMAQYRAVFRNANLKMFLAAATAAAALASTQANAADVTGDTWKDLKTGSTISKGSETFKTSGKATDNFDLTVSGEGKLTFQATTVATAFEKGDDKSGSILLNGEKASVTIGNATNGAKVVIDSFTATAGTLTIGGHDSEASSLEATDIILGGASTKASPAVTVKLGKSGALGGDKSNVSLTTGAKLTLEEQSDKASIAGKTLILNGGDLVVDGAKNLTISSKTVDVKEGSTFSNGTGTVTFDNATSISFAKGTLTNGGKIALGTIGGAVGSARNVSLTVDAEDFNTKLFKGDAHQVSVSGSQAGAGTLTLSATGDAELKLVDSGLFADTGKVDLQKGLVIDAAQKANVNLKVSGKNAAFEADALADSTIGTVSLEFDKLTVGKAATTDFTISNAGITVNNELKVAKSGSSIKLLTGQTGTATLTLGNQNTTNGKLIDIKSVYVGFNGNDKTKNVLNVNGKWDFGGARLSVGASATANINAGAEISNVERLQVGGAPANTEVNIFGTANIQRLVDPTQGDGGNINVKAGGALNILGDGQDPDGPNDKKEYKNDVQLTKAKLNIEAGGTVALAKDAWDDVIKITSGTEFDTFEVVTSGNNTVDFGGWKKENVNLTGGTLRIDLKGHKVADKAALDKLASDLVGASYTGLVDLGGIGIAKELTKQPDGSVNLADMPSVKTDATKDVVVNIKSGETTLPNSLSMGSAKVEGQTLTTAKNSTLEFSNAQDGQFATNTTKDAQDKTVNISLDSGSSLILNGDGSLGNITKGASATSTNAVFGGNKGQQSVGAVDVDSVSVIAGGSVTTAGAVKTGTLEIGTGAALNAQANDITVSKADVVAQISGDIDAKSLSLAGGAVIADGANVDVDTLVGASNMTISVGQDKDPNGTASVYAGTLELKSGTLFVDPDYGQHYASVTVGSFTGNGTVTTSDKSAGVVDGKIIVGKNAALGIGFDSKTDLDAILADYVDPVTKSFADHSVAGATGLANALVLNKQVTFSNANDSIYVGSDGVVTVATARNSVEMKSGSGLIVTDNVFTVDKSGKKTGAAITLSGTSGTVSASGASVILVGDFSAKDDDLILFSGTSSEIKDLSVRTANGLLAGTFSTVNKGHLDLNIVDDMKSKVFLDASAPVKQLLLDKAAGELAQGSGLGWDFIGKYATSSTSGAVVDAAAHAATYAGAQVAAVAAVGTMAEAVGGRVGSMGVETTVVQATGSAGNGGVWLSPMYKSVDADGFNAEGASYGADVDLAGVAFGTDTVNGNMRFGAVFNIGSGDADGKGNGNGLKDEFDYYGFGIYSVMGFGQLAIVGDASLNVISHEVEGLGLKGSADTTAVTMGVTGQYTISSPAVDVTPHLGARFIRLDTDSYDLKSAEGTLATTDFDVQNVFSIPLGVTLSKAFEMGGWSLAPSADLSITFNTGDTDAKSTTQFTGVKAINLTTEVLDEVTYGVAVGLGAQYGAFGTNIGLNYTGSSNTDSFGVNAQARYMF